MKKSTWYLLLTIALVYTIISLVSSTHYDQHLERLHVRQNVSAVLLISTSTIFLGGVILARPRKDDHL